MLNATLERPAREQSGLERPVKKLSKLKGPPKPRAEFTITAPLSLEHEYMQWLIEHCAKEYDFRFVEIVDGKNGLPDGYVFAVLGGTGAYLLTAHRRGGKYYPVSCTCPAFMRRGGPCKHDGLFRYQYDTLPAMAGEGIKPYSAGMHMADMPGADRFAPHSPMGEVDHIESFRRGSSNHGYRNEW